MTKDDWYADRIMWRAGQHRLFEKRCVRFEDLNAQGRRMITDQAEFIGKPLLVFFDSAERWTVLTTSEIVSRFDGQIHRASLDAIKKEVELVRPAGVDSEELKRSANRLRLPKTNAEVWAPEGNELFGLMNILQMFPLSIPSQK